METNFKKKNKKHSPIVRLKKTAWTNFSIYTRKRDSNSDDYCQCTTCLIIKLAKQMQAGHYIPKGSCRVLEYNPINVHAQCYGCNVMNPQKAMLDYERYIINSYGSRVNESMKVIYHSHISYISTTPYLNSIIEKCKNNNFDYDEEVETILNLAVYVRLSDGEKESFKKKFNPVFALGL